MIPKSVKRFSDKIMRKVKTKTAKKAAKRKTAKRSRAKADVRVKRAYDPPSGDDGLRILIDRLWPRGLSRSQA